MYFSERYGKQECVMVSHGILNAIVWYIMVILSYGICYAKATPALWIDPDFSALIAAI